MSTNNCPCPDPDQEPDDPCCPDTIDLASAVDVRDRACKKRRILAGLKGLFGIKSKKWARIDGSDSLPLTMDFAQKLSAAGYVIIQEPGGRVLAIKPDPSLASANSVLPFGLKDGALKFFTFDFSNQSIADSEMPPVAGGVLAAISCAGNGRIRIGKFLPGCEGVRYLVINEDGAVTCDTQEVTECPNVTAAAELDSLWGCVDGVKTPILPVAGKTLIGITGPKWGLVDDVGDSLAVARTSIYNKTYGVDAGALNTDVINASTLPGYDAKWKWVKLHFSYKAQTSTTDFSHELAVNGRKYVGINLIAGAFQGEENNNSADVPIPSDKLLTVTNTRTLYQAGSSSGQQFVNIWIDGWSV